MNEFIGRRQGHFRPGYGYVNVVIAEGRLKQKVVKIIEGRKKIPFTNVLVLRTTAEPTISLEPALSPS